MRTLIALTAALLMTSSAAALERRNYIHVTPPAVPHPLPQGVPYVIIGGPSHAPITLRYGFIHGERVLFEPHSGRIVYILNP
jgi:hypothetical protein